VPPVIARAARLTRKPHHDTVREKTGPHVPVPGSPHEDLPLLVARAWTADVHPARAWQLENFTSWPLPLDVTLEVSTCQPSNNCGDKQMVGIHCNRGLPWWAAAVQERPRSRRGIHCVLLDRVNTN
jgi:hypothetical protein